MKNSYAELPLRLAACFFLNGDNDNSFCLVLQGPPLSPALYLSGT
ncbi:hypothetical protein ANCDUO_19689 [Ancylostoma duodenale]|uniref:Uncharacterized protein n=1 Tax=Ancylostoma duodenale TaxID=51022 RepID=A0A0C2FU80_9BILA|nr:hypothetical protein ANCDUO_19689 [Ancylostoma duodenale]